MKKRLPKIALLITMLLFATFYLLSFLGNNSLSLKGKVVITVVEKQDDTDGTENSTDKNTSDSIFCSFTSALGNFADTQTSQFTEMLNGNLAAQDNVTPVNDPYREHEIALYCLDIGQGSSMVFRVGNEYMLFDGGDWESSDVLLQKLDTLGITEFQYVFVSHYDSDHVAGIISVLEKYTVRNLVAPDYVTDTDTYRNFTYTVQECGFDIIYPYPEQKFVLGDAVLTCVAPCDDSYMNENDYSIGLRIVYENFSVLVCGDATSVSEEEMLAYGQDLQSTVYIVNHHGSTSSTSQAFIERVAPEISIISCGAQNDYGHPTLMVLERIRNVGSLLLRTDQHGDVVITSDGETFHAYAEKPYIEDILWEPGVPANG